MLYLSFFASERKQGMPSETVLFLKKLPHKSDSYHFLFRLSQFYISLLSQHIKKWRYACKECFIWSFFPQKVNKVYPQKPFYSWTNFPVNQIHIAFYSIFRNFSFYHFPQKTVITVKFQMSAYSAGKGGQKRHNTIVASYCLAFLFVI